MVIIIGKSGYLGGFLAEYYKTNYNVIGISYRPQKEKVFEKELTDILKSREVKLVINASASQIMTDDTVDMLELVHSNTIMPALVASLINQYSKSTVFINIGTYWESSANRSTPFNLYSATKTAASEILKHYFQVGVKVSHLKLCDVYGENDERNKVLNYLFKSVSEKTKLNMSGGEQFIKMINIHDVVDAIDYVYNQMSTTGFSVFPSYDVCPDKCIKVKDLASLVFDIGGESIEDYVDFGVYPYREGELFSPIESNRIPGWKCSRDLRSEIYKIYKEKHSA